LAASASTNAVKEQTAPAADAEAAGSSFDSTWGEQLKALLGRELAVRKRSKILTKAVFGRTLVISFLLSTLYWQAEKDQQGVFSITGALSFIVLNHVFTYVIGQAVNMPTVVPTLKREHHANMYSVESWYLSKTIADLPFDLLTTFVLATVCYWAIGFTDSGSNYAYFLLMLVLVALLATGFGHLMGVVASVLDKPELAVRDKRSTRRIK
jgi:ABC-type multidrug transport system permease subunit